MTIRTIKHQELVTIRGNQSDINELVGSIVGYLVEMPDPKSPLGKLLSLATIEVAAAIEVPPADELETATEIYLVYEHDAPQIATVEQDVAQRISTQAQLRAETSPTAKFLTKSPIKIEKVPLIRSFTDEDDIDDVM